MPYLYLCFGLILIFRDSGNALPCLLLILLLLFFIFAIEGLNLMRVRRIRGGFGIFIEVFVSAFFIVLTHCLLFLLVLCSALSNKDCWFHLYTFFLYCGWHHGPILQSSKMLFTIHYIFWQGLSLFSNIDTASTSKIKYLHKSESMTEVMIRNWIVSTCNFLCKSFYVGIIKIGLRKSILHDNLCS